MSKNPTKVVIPGGTGQLGSMLAKKFLAQNSEKKCDVVILTRHPQETSDGTRQVAWDGQNLGDWAKEIDGADVVINLAGRSVDCRYSDENLKAMMDSRVHSTRIVGEAIAKASQPPPIWLQMSTATLYAHRFDAPNDETTGIIGGEEPNVPSYWGYSVEIAKAWEKELEEANTPKTRKIALRTSMVMSPDAGGVFDVLLSLTKWRLGGTIAGGKQYVSWIHGDDFVRAIQLLIERDDLHGAFNLASPHPLVQRDFMASIRKARGINLGLPATAWMVKIGAFFMGTDAELVLKSRRVVPRRLLDAGMTFSFPEWMEASQDLVARMDS